MQAKALKRSRKNCRYCNIMGSERLDSMVMCKKSYEMTNGPSHRCIAVNGGIACEDI